MRISIAIAFFFLSLSCSAQQSVVIKDTSQANVDSLIKRIQRLERNQTVIMMGLHDSGKQIRIGGALLGIGILASLTGTALLSLVSPRIVTDRYGQTVSRLSTGQIVGVAIGTAGIGLSIGGAFNISAGGKSLRDL